MITFSLEQYFNDIFAFENRGTKRNTVRNGHPGCRGRVPAVGVVDVATPELVVVVVSVAAERRGRGRSVEREVIVVGAMSNSRSVV